jgi:hypothetical protein
MLPCRRDAAERTAHLPFLEDLHGHRSVLQERLTHRAKGSVAQVPAELHVLQLDNVKIMVLKNCAAADVLQ